MLDILTNIKKEWIPLLKNNKLIEILNEIDLTSNNLCPNKYNIFEAFKYFHPKDTKVCILGQDPYPSKHAHGLSFSSKSKKIPSSLKNIFKCINKSGYMYNNAHSADLTNWCKQNILLLNSALTTIEGKPNTHKQLWGKYIRDLLYNLIYINPDIIFILWGNNAKKVIYDVEKRCNFKINKLMFGHPSPLRRIMTENDKFENCNNFLSCNLKLILNGKKPIIWDNNVPISKEYLFLTYYSTYENLSQCIIYYFINYKNKKFLLYNPDNKKCYHSKKNNKDIKYLIKSINMNHSKYNFLVIMTDNFNNNIKYICKNIITINFHMINIKEFNNVCPNFIKNIKPLIYNKLINYNLNYDS